MSGMVSAVLPSRRQGERCASGANRFVNTSCPSCRREAHVRQYGLGHVRVRVCRGCAGFSDFHGIHRRTEWRLHHGAQAWALRDSDCPDLKKAVLQASLQLDAGRPSGRPRLSEHLAAASGAAVKSPRRPPVTDLGRGRRDPFERMPWSRYLQSKAPVLQGHTATATGLHRLSEATEVRGHG